MAFLDVEKSTYTNSVSMLNLHSHPHFEIYFLKSGSRTFFLSNALYDLQGPLIIIIPPHTLHKTEGGPFERYNVNVSKSYLDDFQCEVLTAKALHLLKLTSEYSNKVEELLEPLCQKSHLKYEKNIKHTLFSYFIYLLYNIEKEDLKPTAHLKQDAPPVLLKIMKYLDENYNQKITLNSVADKFYLSSTALSYMFKKYMHNTLIDYVLFLRINKAKEFLCHTNKSVETIAELCGFSSSNYFGLIFKQKENLSPMQYRKYNKCY